MMRMMMMMMMMMMMVMMMVMMMMMMMMMMVMMMMVMVMSRLCLLCSDGCVSAVNTSTGLCMLRCRPYHTSVVHSVDLTHSHSAVVSGSRDATVKVIVSRSRSN